tara:strand:- start:6094 stop:6321 length:228 start_codon:yes stop_codon:yes gene_type:complete
VYNKEYIEGVLIMKHRYIVNFSTSEHTIERTVVMMAKDKREVQDTLEEEFADFDEKLHIISINEDKKQEKFVLDF